MATHKTVNDAPTGRHAHRPSIAIEGATERCPLCGQPVQQIQYTALQKKLEARVRAGLQEAEKALRDGFARQVKAEAEKARREAAKAAEAQVKSALANQEKVISQRLQTQRAALEKAKSAAVNVEREKHFQEKLKLEERLQEMQRRLQKRSANELGNEGELDLFQQLQQEFPTDQIERVKKGKQGGDIIHRIVGQNGQICGKIIYDVKNTTRLLSRYLIKLRADQLDAEADHGVLSTQACTQHLEVREGVVVVHPLRTVAVARLLRHQVIQVYGLKLGNEGRAEKAQQLYALMQSDRAAHLWNEIVDAANELKALDRSERISHDKIWDRRADLIRQVQEAHHSFAEAIDRIIGATGLEASP